VRKDDYAQSKSVEKIKYRFLDTEVAHLAYFRRNVGGDLIIIKL